MVKGRKRRSYVRAGRVRGAGGREHPSGHEYMCQCGGREGTETTRKLMWWHRWAIGQRNPILERVLIQRLGSV